MKQPADGTPVVFATSDGAVLQGEATTVLKTPGRGKVRLWITRVNDRKVTPWVVEVDAERVVAR